MLQQPHLSRRTLHTLRFCGPTCSRSDGELWTLECSNQVLKGQIIPICHFADMVRKPSSLSRHSNTICSISNCVLAWEFKEGEGGGEGGCYSHGYDAQLLCYTFSVTTLCYYAPIWIRGNKRSQTQDKDNRWSILAAFSVVHFESWSSITVTFWKWD